MYPSIHLRLAEQVNIPVRQRISMGRIPREDEDGSDVPPQPNRHFSQIRYGGVYSDVRGAAHAYSPLVAAIVVRHVGRDEVSWAFAAVGGVVWDAGWGDGWEGG